MGVSQFEGKFGELGDVSSSGTEIMRIFYSSKLLEMPESPAHPLGEEGRPQPGGSGYLLHTQTALHASSLTLPSFSLQIWFFLHFLNSHPQGEGCLQPPAWPGTSLSLLQAHSQNPASPNVGSDGPQRCWPETCKAEEKWFLWQNYKCSIKHSLSGAFLMWF